MNSTPIAHNGLSPFFVKSHFDEYNSIAFEDPVTWKLWSWIKKSIAQANCVVSWRSGRGTIAVPLKPGQCVFGRNQWEAVLRCPGKTLERHLKRLQNAGFLTIQPTRQYTIITLCHVNRYVWSHHDRDQPSGPPATQQRPSNGPPVATYKDSRSLEAKSQSEDHSCVSLESTRTSSALALSSPTVENASSPFVHPSWRDNESEVWRRYRKLKRQVPPSHNAKDRPHDKWLLLRTAFLWAIGVISENCIVNTTEAIKHSTSDVRRPVGYLYMLLRKDRGDAELKQLLSQANIIIPSEIYQQVFGQVENGTSGNNRGG